MWFDNSLHLLIVIKKNPKKLEKLQKTKKQKNKNKNKNKNKTKTLLEKSILNSPKILYVNLQTF